jgi:hypothetical protein
MKNWRGELFSIPEQQIKSLQLAQQNRFSPLPLLPEEEGRLNLQSAVDI